MSNEEESKLIEKIEAALEDDVEPVLLFDELSHIALRLSRLRQIEANPLVEHIYLDRITTQDIAGREIYQGHNVRMLLVNGEQMEFKSVSFDIRPKGWRQ